MGIAFFKLDRKLLWMGYILWSWPMDDGMAISPAILGHHHLRDSEPGEESIFEEK